MRLLKIIVMITCVLTGCSNDQLSHAMFDNYLYRLSNSLDVNNEYDLEESYRSLSKKLMRYPKKSVLLHTIPDIDVNILQFLQLSKCDLQRLVGKRNSSLGKLISGYHSLLYEYEFLLLATRCKNELEQEAPLYDVLAKAIEHKKNYQRQLRWNVTFASAEVSYLFSLSTQPLSSEQLINKPVELVAGLEALNNWLTNSTTDSTALEGAYKAFEKRKYIGELRLTMALSTSALLQADNLIQERFIDKPLSHKQQASPAFEVVNRVFHKFYIGEVQPMLAKLHQQGQTLFDVLDRLQSSVEPTADFVDFWGHIYTFEDSEWQVFNQAILNHTKSWQTLLMQCGRLPK